MASTPVWPQYVPDATERTLWYQRHDGHWVHATDGEVREATSLREVADLLFGSNGIAFCADLARLPWFDELAYYLPQVDAATGRKPAPKGDELQVEISVHPATYAPTSITIIRKWPDKNGRKCRQTRKVVSAATWAMPCGPELVTRLRWLYDTLGCGALPTPAAVGEWLMKQEWLDPETGELKSDFPRHHRPCLTLVHDMSQHAVGARKEAYNPEGIYDRAYGADMTNGYAAQAGVLPSGTVGTFGGNGMAHKYLMPLLNDPELRAKSRIRHWWGQCYVRIWRDLPPGDIAPFAVRSDETDDLVWPTRAGTYWTWLWSFEAEEIQRRYREDGCMEVIGVETAYTWETETTQLAGWANKMDVLRRSVEFGQLGESVSDSNERKTLARMIKQCIVAGIGRLGMAYASLGVIPASAAGEGDMPLQSESLPDTGLAVRQTFKDMATPLHWHKFILSKMNFVMYQKAREAWQAGNDPIGLNVDELVTVAPMAGTVEREVAAMGEFKGNEYLGYYAMPGPGTVITPGKLRTPGLPAAARGAIMKGAMRGQLYRTGEHAQPQSRGELLAEQGKRVWLDEMHRLSKTALSRRERARAKEIEECENLRLWYVQRRYWDRIAGREA